MPIVANSFLMRAAHAVLLLVTGLALSAAESGQQLFISNCAACHGLDGRGGKHAPNIATDSKIQQLSDARLLQIIKTGVASAGMPGFGASLNDGQLNELVSYLRTLEGKGVVSKVTGNSSEGKILFFGTAHCSECHMIDGKGGFIGSDLSGYGSTHTPEQIRDAILDPNKNLAPENRTIIIVDRDGRIYRGIARNEDNFSLQLQSLNGDFHLFNKADIRRIDRETQSLMPADYGQKLTPGELSDLVNYLVKSVNGRVGAAKDDDDF